METANTALYLASSAFVFLMAIGFIFLEAGLVGYKSVSSVITKNIVAVCVTTIAFYFVGGHVMWSGSIWDIPGRGPWEADRDAGVRWLFGSLFVVASSSIVSGAVAVRVKIPVFLVFAAVNGAFIYPVLGYWVWGGGWLQEAGYTDFAGASVVHMSGGIASLVACIFLGPRLNRFAREDTQQSENTLRPSSIPLTTLGVCLLWLGWYGFNGGSALPVSGPGDFDRIVQVILNTHWGAIGGFAFGLLFPIVMKRRWDVVSTLNAGLAGLVVTTAAPFGSDVEWFLFLGAAAGAVMYATQVILERLHIDDVVGAVPVHLTPGLVAIIAAALQPGIDLRTQLIGAAAVVGFCLASNAALWWSMKKTVGIRITTHDEIEGSDTVQTSQRAYDLIDADMRHFSYFATHDLKEPLRSITSLAQLAELETDSESNRSYLRRIRAAANHMRSLIEDLIVYSSLGNVKLRYEAIDIRTLAEEIFQKELRMHEEETQPELICIDLPVIACDAVLMRHVISNLIGNAIKYRVRNRTARIRVEAALVKDAWHVSVRDNGKGIEQDYTTRIFDVFARFDDDSGISGNGIGLAIVRKAVYRMGGTIWVQSRIGSGTSFTFTLPKIEADEKPAETAG